MDFAALMKVPYLTGYSHIRHPTAGQWGGSMLVACLHLYIILETEISPGLVFTVVRLLDQLYGFKFLANLKLLLPTTRSWFSLIVRMAPPRVRVHSAEQIKSSKLADREGPH